MTRYRCVDARKAEGLCVRAACAVVEVPTSSYYDWVTRRDAPPTRRELDEAALVAVMNEIFDASDGAYGVPRMWHALRDRGLVVNRKLRRRGRAAGSGSSMPPVLARVADTADVNVMIHDFRSRPAGMIHNYRCLTSP